jgi:hypothetical protein
LAHAAALVHRAQRHGARIVLNLFAECVCQARSSPSTSSTAVKYGRWPSFAWSFRVTLRSEPIYAPGTLHPIVNVGFADQASDVADIRTGTVGLDLPIPFIDALRLEDDFDSRGFAHEAEYAPSGLSRKPYSGLFYSN